MVSKQTVKSVGYIFTVGRRKEAVARVRLFINGKGEMVVNGKPLNQYFPNFEHQFTILQPLKISGLADKVNFQVKVLGGGKVGQADAVRHGLSRALVLADEKLRKTLKPHGFLTRDARVKERKKPGLKKARRAPQWQKR
ncbi:MAG: 30S ribosomal protein S9 [Patescibacteria group bacterium]